MNLLFDSLQALLLAYLAGIDLRSTARATQSRQAERPLFVDANPLYTVGAPR